MAQYATVAQMNGLYKEAYADGIQALIPDIAYLTKNIAFGEAEKVGNKYHQPVILARELGVTYAASGAGAYTLNNSVAMTMKDASLDGSQITLRSSIPYDTVARSLSSGKAFRKATLPIIENNLESHSKRLELGLLYGQATAGLGTTSGSVNIDGTSTTLTFTAASWAVGVWGGEEGAQVIFFKNSDHAGITAQSSSNNDIFTIVSVDPDNRAMVVSGTSTGISALDAATAAGVDIYFYNGAYDSTGGTTQTFAEMVGIDKIVTNTGTLFGIPANTYNLWKGNTYSAASGQLTLGKITAAVNKAVGKGGLKEKVAVLVSPASWGNLMTDLAALRKFDSSYDSGKGENGFDAIKFYGANGEVEVVIHTAVKDGEAFILPLKRFRRVGATDVTFQTPGRPEELFVQLANANGFEIRSYSDQAVLCQTPAKCVKITTIVPV